MDELVKRVAELAGDGERWVAVAESLTCGELAARVGAGPDASSWFRGGVVAYDESVKFDVLGVTPGPVVTERCATEMALGVAKLLGADATVATTGVGGPDPDEGHPAGTVVLAVASHGQVTCRWHHFDGDPPEVLEQTTAAAVALLAETLAQDGDEAR